MGKSVDELIFFFSTFNGLPFDKNFVAMLMILDSSSLLSDKIDPRSPRPRFIKLCLNFSAADTNPSPSGYSFGGILILNICDSFILIFPSLCLKT